MNFEKPYEMELVEKVLNDLNDQWWDLGEEKANLMIELRDCDSSENRDVIRGKIEELRERMLKIEDIMDSIRVSYFETYGVEWEYVDEEDE